MRNALTTIWLYRLPSLIGAIGAVLLTYWTALAFVSRRAAVLAGLMMASSILLGVEARLAKTDAMLLATIVAAMGAMARIYLGEQRVRPGLAGWILPAVFWTALAAGILIKGPLILLFVGLDHRRLAGGRPVLALAAAAAAVAWHRVARAAGGCPGSSPSEPEPATAFVAESVGQDLLPKIFSGQESHGAPPGFYFLLFWVTFWPAATLAAMAAPAVWASRREKGARFLLAWIVPAWIVFELVITKLPHYVLPLYPAIAILIAGVVDSHRLRAQELDGARHRVVVRAAGSAGDRHRRRPGHVRPPAWAAGLAVRRRRAGASACWRGGCSRPTAPSARCCARSRPRS